MNTKRGLIILSVLVLGLTIVSFTLVAASTTASPKHITLQQNDHKPANIYSKVESAAPLTTAHAYTSTPSIAIPENACATMLTDTITVPEAQYVYRLTVGLNISHTYRSDLKISLRSPDGTILLLLDGDGGSYQNFDVVLDRDAFAPPGGPPGDNNHDYAPPYYDYSWQAQDDLIMFNNLYAQGDWTLEFCDAVGGGNAGELNLWSLWLDLGPARADLSDSRKEAPYKVAVGDPLTYTIVVNNTGSLSTTNATMTDYIPYGTSYISDSLSCSASTCYTSATSDGTAIIWDGDILPSSGVSITFAVNTDISTLINNTAYITGSNLEHELALHATTEVVPEIYYSWDFESGWDDFSPSTGMHEDWECGTPTAFPPHPPMMRGESKMWGTLIDASYSPDSYSILSRSIDLTAISPANGLILQWWEWVAIDDGDAGVLRLNGTDIHHTATSFNYWQLQSYDISAYAGEMITMEWIFQADSDPSTVDMGWYIDDITIHEAIPEADIVINKVAAPDPVIVGETIIYTISISNNGPDAASGTQMFEYLPAGVTPASIVTTKGTCSPVDQQPINCVVGLMDYGEIATIVITGTVNATAEAGGELINYATVSSDVNDPFPDNNSTIVNTSVSAAHLTAPRVYSITPESGVNTSATPIIIQGDNFGSGMSANLEGTSIQVISLVSSQRLLARVPSGLAPGTYDLTVVAPNAESGTLLDAFTVLSDSPPAITGIDPPDGLNDAPVIVHIYGSNFSPGMDAKISNSGGDIPLESLHFVNNGRLRATVPMNILTGVYTLTLTDADANSGSLPYGYTSLDAFTADDLFANQFSDIWLVPHSVRAGELTTIGLTIRRRGGQGDLINVVVDFYLDALPTSGGVFLGGGVASTLEPNATTRATISTTALTAGPHIIYAIIDPENNIPEDDEDNNIIIRTLRVLPAGSTPSPIAIENLTINDGADDTRFQQVRLNVTASNQPAYLLYVEYQYIQSRHDWMPVAQSGWLPYAAASVDYAWKLQPGAGVHYIQVWLADFGGFVAPTSGMAFINLKPAPTHVAAQEVNIYHYALNSGESLLVRLTSLSGDADLYIWGPDGSLIDKSETGEAVEEIQFTVTSTGTHQIEVEGYSSANYNLAIVPMAATSPGSSKRPEDNAPMQRGRDQPFCTSTSPNEDIGLPDVPENGYTIYLPVIMR